jgi:hypothetical protein
MTLVILCKLPINQDCDHVLAYITHVTRPNSLSHPRQHVYTCYMRLEIKVSFACHLKISAADVVVSQSKSNFPEVIEQNTLHNPQMFFEVVFQISNSKFNNQDGR